jgi:hypothetical protein
MSNPYDPSDDSFPDSDGSEENKTQEYLELLAQDPVIQSWIIEYSLNPYGVEEEHLLDAVPNLSESSSLMLFGLSLNEISELGKTDTDEEAEKILKRANRDALVFQGQDVFDLFIEYVRLACLNKINNTYFH